MSISIDHLLTVESFLKIRSTSLFSMFSTSDVKKMLETGAVVEEYAPNQEVIPRKEDTDLYIVVDGRVRLEEFVNGATRVVGTVTEGRSLELSWTLGLTARLYRWIADDHVKVMRLNKLHLDKLFAKKPKARDYLVKILTYREFFQFKHHLGISNFSYQEVIEAIVEMKFFKYDSESKFELNEGGELILVANGEVAVWGTNDLEGRVITRISHGNYSAIPDNELFKYVISPGTVLWRVSIPDFLKTSENAHLFLKLCQLVEQSLKSIRESWNPLENMINYVNTEVSESSKSTEPEPEIEDFYPKNVERIKFGRKKRICVRQRDYMDCGAACLSSISKYWGRNIDIAQFRGLINVTKSGASLFALQRGARHVGFSSIGITSGFESLSQFVTPFIALMKLHYVVVYKVTANSVLVADPAIGLRSVSAEEFKREYSGNLLLLKPKRELYDFPESRSNFFKYTSIMKGHWQMLVLSLMFSLVGFFLALATPFISQLMMDGVVLEKNASLLMNLAIITVGITIFSAILSFSQEFLTTHYVSSLDVKFSSLFMRHIFKLPVEYFLSRTAGDFALRISELGSVRSFISQKPIHLFMTVLSLVVYGSVLFAYSVKIALFIFACVPILLCLIIFVTPRFKAFSEKIFQASANQSALFFEQIKVISSIAAVSGSLAARWRWERAMIDHLALSTTFDKYQATFSVVKSVISLFITTTVTVLSIFAFLANEITLGQVLAIGAISLQVISPCIALVEEWRSLHEAALSFGRLDDIFTAKTEEEPLEVTALPEKLTGNIRIDNVSFKYGGDLSPWNLKNVSMDIPKGSLVAFVGRSGSGKTTMAMMLNRLYVPQLGQISIDGIPTSKMPLGYLRKNISMVLQDNFLINGSIIDNIAFGDPNPDVQRVIQSAIAADAHGFIMNTERGYGTILGEEGSSVSGGQKQRLCIARVLYSQSPILVLDEATSALDAVSERKIMSSIKNSKRDHTVVVVAHRLNTVVNADYIYVFEGGVITEHGTHADLIKKSGKYYNFFKRQLVA
jgi:subfamily B ATP-binding cassette protein HlyB/CyaB